MPKALHSSIRKDAEIRIRVSYSFQAKVREYAKKQKKSVSTLIRELLDKEIQGNK